MTTPPSFLFATGIENSYPTIRNGSFRVDEMEKCGHYEQWRTDFSLVRELDIRYLRYGPPIHKTWLGPGKYDWEFCDLTFGELRRLEIMPITDLCHFGVPDWVGDFQNPDFPALFAAYARDFALRFPWIQLYTPINEMFVCATFSAAYGWWNEQLSSDTAFVTALKNIVKANVMAMHAILEVRPDAIFIQSESSEYFHTDAPASIKPAEILNARRFLSLDLNYGRRVDSEMYEFLFDNGMTREEYHFFLENNLKHFCIMGNDYYVTNEHRVAPDGSTRPSGEVFGYAEITWQYYDRYRLPVMHTETNLWQGQNGDEAVYWLWKEWANVLRVRNDGIPVVGFTWYSLTDQVDWDSALREPNGRLNPVGLYDLDRKIRPVGQAYKELISSWKDVLPTQSACLRVPIAPMDEIPSTSLAVNPHRPNPPVVIAVTNTQLERKRIFMRFQDKVVIVTGAASGIGLATAKRFGSDGARVVIANLDQAKCDEAAAQVKTAGAPDTWGSACDVSQESQVIATVQGTLERFGRLDIVVNNAGLMIFKRFEEHTEEDWLKILHVDLLGAFFFVKQAFLTMKPGGAIVNVSSIHAIATTPNVASYAAAKAAMLSLTRSASIEGKEKGIRVNAVLPGAIDTPMLWDNPNIKAGLEVINKADVGKPEDVAAAIAYLASDDAAFVQGVSLNVDGSRLDRL